VKLSFIKKHACAMVGDTTQTSRLYTDYSADYVNKVVQETLNFVRSRTKDCPFLMTETTISYDSTASNDYLLPQDFREMEVIHMTYGGYDYRLDHVTNEVFLRIQSGQSYDRYVYTCYYDKDTKRWRMRVYYPINVTPTQFKLTYKRGQSYVYNDNDEITIFPEDHGWEWVIIHGTADMCYMMHQQGLNEPKARYEELLDRMIKALNSDAPDDVDITPKSEFDKERIRETFDRY